MPRSILYPCFFVLSACLAFPFCRSVVKQSRKPEAPDCPRPSESFLWQDRGQDVQGQDVQGQDAQGAFPTIALPPTQEREPSLVTDKQGRIKKVLSQTSDSLGRVVNLALSGEELTREELVRKGKPLVRIRLRGNAKLYHNQIRIRAQHITIENQDLGEISGNIEIYDPRTKIWVYGQKASYERKKQKIRLRGNPYIQKKLSTHESLLISCQSLDYLLEERHLFLRGGVRANSGNRNMAAERGKYLASQKKLILETNPTFWSPQVYLVGKTLIFEERKRSLELNGESLLYGQLSLSLGPEPIKTKPDAIQESSKLPSLENYARNSSRVRPLLAEDKTQSKTPLLFSSGIRAREKSKNDFFEANAKTPAKEISILTADKIRYNYSGSVEAQGNVLLTQVDLRFQADSLSLFGKRHQDISAKGKVYAIDHKRKMELEAQQLQYKDTLQRLVLKGKASLSFYENLDSQQQAESPSKAKAPTRLSGEYIERDFAKKRTEAQGKVRLSQESFRALAEFATYHEDAEVLIMQGNPGVYKDKTFIKAEKIFIYPKKERMLFQKQVRSSFEK